MKKINLSVASLILAIFCVFSSVVFAAGEAQKDIQFALDDVYLVSVNGQYYDVFCGTWVAGEVRYYMEKVKAPDLENRNRPVVFYLGLIPGQPIGVKVVSISDLRGHEEEIFHWSKKVAIGERYKNVNLDSAVFHEDASNPYLTFQHRGSLSGMSIGIGPDGSTFFTGVNRELIVSLSVVPMTPVTK